MSVPAKTAPEDDRVMQGALGILAYAGSMLTHEALGHGGFCLVTGGRNVLLTPWAERCDYLAAAPFGIQAAGPAVQFAAGLLAWWALRGLSTRPDRSSRFAAVRYCLWLTMVFDLLVASGYVAFSGVTDFGDAAVLIAGRTPPLLWRGLLLVVGGAIYFGSMHAAAFELQRLTGRDASRPRLARCVWTPYLTAGVLACCAGAMNRTSSPGLALPLAVASSFGGAFGLLRLPHMVRDRRSPTAPPPFDAMPYLRRSSPWLVAALIVAVAFVFVLGRGIELTPS